MDIRLSEGMRIVLPMPDTSGMTQEHAQFVLFRRTLAQTALDKANPYYRPKSLGDAVRVGKTWFGHGPQGFGCYA